MDNSANCINLPYFYFFSYLCVVVKERAEFSQAEDFHPLPIRFGKIVLFIKVVGVTGFEPVTLRLSSACSNQLSYTPIKPNWLAEP